MVQSMRSQGEAEYVAGINTEVDAPPQITVQRQEEIVEGFSKHREKGGASNSTCWQKWGTIQELPAENALPKPNCKMSTLW